MKQKLCLILALVLALGLVLPQTVHAAGTLSVTSVSGEAGEQVTVEVCLTSDDVASGNFYVCYDTDCLELISYSKGDSGYLCTVNEKEKGNVYVGFAQDSPLLETVLCRMIFRITATTPAAGSTLTLQNVRLYNVNSKLTDTTLVFGKVTRDCAWFTLSGTDTVAGQDVRAEVGLSGALQPCGGSFAVTYDASVLKATGVLALDALDGCSVSYNLQEEGVVRVAFAGDVPLESGKLCAIVFQTLGSAGAGTTLELADVRAYDEDSAPLDTAVFSGSINVILPSENAPKLWVVGGALTDDGTATASVLLQNQGIVCGGQFTLNFAPSLMVTVDAAAGVAYHIENGALSVSWAKETPATQLETLVTLQFTQAFESNLTFGSNVRLYDCDSQQLGVCDIRSGALTKSAQVHMTVDDVEISYSATGSEVSLTVDLADADFFTDEQVKTATPMLALYRDGRLLELVIAPDVSLSSGVAEVSLSAASDVPLTDYTVFVTSNSFTPLCSSVTGQ